MHCSSINIFSYCNNKRSYTQPTSCICKPTSTITRCMKPTPIFTTYVKTNIDIVELEIFKFIKIAIIIYFFVRTCLGLIEYFVKPIKIDTNPDIEESIYHTLHTQKFYLQIGFPDTSPLHGNIVIYQLNIRLTTNENLDYKPRSSNTPTRTRN